MSEPSRDVTDVARSIVDREGYKCLDSGTVRHLLTSTDPAVLDAMQDALVRAGRLRAIHDSWPERSRKQVRYLTDWREVEP